MKQEKEAPSKMKSTICYKPSRVHLVVQQACAAANFLNMSQSVSARMFSPLIIGMANGTKTLLTRKSIPSSDKNSEAYSISTKQHKYRYGSNRFRHRMLHISPLDRILHQYGSKKLTNHHFGFLVNIEIPRVQL